ncbi:phosphoribosyltransferase [Miltoncostaea marina]|uniref:phosphoribosyltransferase n=1 Tax=Miltoncostaea marina TaxID=2843215 RepID=UPI001C3C9EFA|nr:phosphoribosyltransferase family protein [Miltoncostaea marina]
MGGERFRDRREAGRVLASLLAGAAGDDLVVLGLPRGGVPVAWEVARALGAPLDVVVVRKLGVPGREELAMGAVASGGVLVVNDDVTAGLRLGDAELRRAARAAIAAVEEREARYRAGRPALDLRDRRALLVDDGLATGATMRAAVGAVARAGAAAVIVAVPVGAAEVCARLRAEVDDLVCARTPSPFRAVGAWYRDFEPTSDEEVRALLARPPAEAP